MTDMYLEMTRLFFIIGGGAALVLGAILFVHPATITSIGRTANRWYSGRRTSKPLDVVRETDSFYFNHHLPIGLIMIVASFVAIYLVWGRIPTTQEVMSITGDLETGMSLGIFLESTKWILLLFIVLGLPVWFLLAFVPHKLKDLNKLMNTWISTRLLLLPLEKMNNGFDEVVLKYHRLFGGFFVLGSLFILFKFIF